MRRGKTASDFKVGDLVMLDHTAFMGSSYDKTLWVVTGTDGSSTYPLTAKMLSTGEEAPFYPNEFVFPEEEVPDA